MSRVVVRAEELGWGLVDAVPSELPGPAGNREFFLHLRSGVASNIGAVERSCAEVTDEDR